MGLADLSQETYKVSSMVSGPCLYVYIMSYDTKKFLTPLLDAAGYSIPDSNIHRFRGVDPYPFYVSKAFVYAKPH